MELYNLNRTSEYSQQIDRYKYQRNPLAKCFRANEPALCVKSETISRSVNFILHLKKKQITLLCARKRYSKLPPRKMKNKIFTRRNCSNQKSSSQDRKDANQLNINVE